MLVAFEYVLQSRQCPDRFPAGPSDFKAPDLWIVANHRFPAGGEPHIELKAIATVRQGAVERCQRVLGNRCDGTGTTVAEKERATALPRSQIHHQVHRNHQTRAFAKRFAAANNGKYPTMVQAGVYSAITHYLKAVEAGKTDDGTKTIAKMKELPTDDPLFGKGRVRMDGRKIHPAYLVEVKKPSESKGPYDYYKIRATIPADQAFRPLNEGGCSLVK